MSFTVWLGDVLLGIAGGYAVVGLTVSLGSILLARTIELGVEGDDL